MRTYFHRSLLIYYNHYHQIIIRFYVTQLSFYRPFCFHFVWMILSFHLLSFFNMSKYIHQITCFNTILLQHNSSKSFITTVLGMAIHHSNILHSLTHPFNHLPYSISSYLLFISFLTFYTLSLIHSSVLHGVFLTIIYISVSGVMPISG